MPALVMSYLRSLKLSGLLPPSPPSTTTEGSHAES